MGRNQAGLETSDGLDRDAIRERLAEAPPEFAIAVAWRTAARALPVLNQDPALWENEYGRRRLLAVLQAINVARFWTYNADAAAANAAAYAAAKADAVGDAYAAHVAYAAKAAANAAVAAVVAAKAAGDANAAHVAYAAKAAANAAVAAVAAAPNAAAYAAIIHSLRDDLESVDRRSLEFATTSLWIAPSTEVQTELAKFDQWLRGLGDGFDYWADWYAEVCKGGSDFCSIDAVVLPQEIEAQGVAKVNAYLKSLGQSALSPLNRARAIFIGHGAAGKTSLIRILHGEKVRKDEDATPGIQIRTWPVPETEIQADLWDFGGQVIAHATHQFFLRERCLYVLVLDARTETNANDQAEYWLEHVQAFGKSAPVMLVGNKVDVAPVNLDLGRLQEKHSNVVGFYPLSCAQLDRFGAEWERFQRDFGENLAQAGTHQLMLQGSHFTVLQQLRERSGKEAFLKKDKFEQLCEEKQVETDGELNREWLLDLLDKLGVIVHFPNIDSLDEFVLNPRWLTYGVYTIIYAQRAHDKQGEITIDDVKEVLQGERVEDEDGHVLEYPEDKCQFIVDAMVEFKICFRCRDDLDRLIIPALLSPNRPDGLEVPQQDTVRFDFDFDGLLPRHVVPQLIVERHDEIVEKLVWQHGVVIRHAEVEAEAMVEADYHERRVSLIVRGAQKGRYFAVLQDALLKILGRMEGLKYTEWLRLPPPRDGEFLSSGEERRERYRLLLALEADGESTYKSEHGKYDLGEVLGWLPRAKRATKPLEPATPEPAPRPPADSATWKRVAWLGAAAFSILTLVAGVWYGQASRCVPGEPKDCYVNGVKGQTVCADDGRSYGDCIVPATAASASPSATVGARREGAGRKALPTPSSQASATRRPVEPEGTP